MTPILICETLYFSRYFPQTITIICPIVSDPWDEIMSSEAGPSGVHPTDEKGKRKWPESPAQDLTSKKVSLKVRGVAAVREPHIHPEKQEEDHLLDYVDTCPKGISSQYPNPVNIGGTVK